MSTEVIIAIISAIVGSSALFAFIQFLITRKDKKNDQIADLKKSLNESLDDLKKDISGIKEDVQEMKVSVNSDITNLNEKIDKSNAIQSRIRILRANDEMRQDVHHSYEYFRQLHQDITDYEFYCTNHPEFKNNEAVNSIDYINKVYQECLAKNNFLI